jgi:uncharacterized protein
MTAEQVLTQHRSDILRLASEHGARNIRVFGSIARGESSESSDIDLLIDLDQGKSYLDLVAFRDTLMDLLGRQVDVLTEDSIYWLLKRKILREARPL